MEQLDPAANVVSQALAPVEIAKLLGLIPVMLGAMIFSAPLPVLERVAASAAEVAPLGVFGNGRDAVNEAMGVVPVPVRDEVCGEPVALSATESVAEKLVAEAGVRVM